MATYTTKFAFQDWAYVLSEARNKGLIKGGPITRIVVDVGGDGGITPAVLYQLNNNSVFTPPGHFWREYELITREEAQAEARAYHDAKSRFHTDVSDDLA